MSKPVRKAVRCYLIKDNKIVKPDVILPGQQLFIPR